MDTKWRGRGRPKKGTEPSRNWDKTQRTYVALDGYLSQALHEISGDRWMNAIINLALREYIERYYPKALKGDK